MVAPFRLIAWGLFLLSAIPLSGMADPCQAGAAALERRDLDQAQRLLEECLAGSPATVEPYLLLCGVHQLRQDREALYRTARQGLEAFPGEKRFYLTAGTEAARAGRYDEAIAVLSQGRQRWPEDDRLRGLLASAHFARGTALLDAGDSAAAAEALRQATELAPGDVEAHLNLGRALHNLLEPAGALAAFDRVIELNPALPLAWFHRGLSHHTLGEFSRAIDDLSKELSRAPDYAPAYLVRGLSYLATAEWTKARADLETAAVRMPENPRAHYGYARALLQIERLEEAEKSLRRAAALDPEDPAPLNTLVTLLMRLDRAQEARPLARQAAELARRRRTAAPGEIRFESSRRPAP